MVDFIPQSLFGALRATTAVLGGLLALLVRERESLGAVGRKALRGWMFAAPLGLVLLGFFQLQFIVRYPLPGGRRGSEIIAPPRIRTCLGTETSHEQCCPCTEASDEQCLTQTLNLNPATIARCWDGSRVGSNQLVWSLAYVLMIGGSQISLGLLVTRSREAPSPSPLAAAAPRASAGRALFLSYSNRDREFAERLAGDLEARGIAVWWDQWKMEVGDSLPRKIAEAISQSGWFAIVLSPDSVASPWVRAELEQALNLGIEENLAILPILHRPCEIPPALRPKVRADFTGSYQEGLEFLLRCLAPPPQVPGEVPRPS
ncbi:MAG TPA: toll/interleukin-1 receptor domain-containing protein [Thermoanaerobaculia bacterium]|nr:toll/interleukin-1 receptor domain-containing protein [Thermoanaerobaculia bacterium]